MAQKRAEALAGLEEMDIDVSSPAKNSPRSGSPSSREGSPKPKAKGLTAQLEELHCSSSSSSIREAFGLTRPSAVAARVEVSRGASSCRLPLMISTCSVDWRCERPVWREGVNGGLDRREVGAQGVEERAERIRPRDEACVA